MPDSNQIRLDRWRLVIPRRDSAEVLVQIEQGRFVLPEVRTPHNQRLAWHLNDQLKSNWQLEIVSMFPIDTQPSVREENSLGYHLAEILQPDVPLPSDMRWVNVSSLSPESLGSERDFTALQSFERRPPDGSGKEPSFGRLGWFREIAAWLGHTAPSLGLAWNGGFEQFHASASFSLIRFATTPFPVWFKAVGEPNTREFHIMQVLAEHCPEYVPRLLALRPEWNAWLAEECSGKTLDEVFDFDLWCKAARTLAELQIESRPHTDELLRAGACNLGSLFSLSSIGQLLTLARALVSRNSQPDPRDPAVEELPALEVRLRELLDDFRALRVPNTLGHLDLTAGNVIVSPQRSAYLDWAEACVGFPFITFEYLVQAFRRTLGHERPAEPALVNAFLSAWEGVLPSGEVREAWRLTPALAVLAYALRCMSASEPYHTTVPRVANYLRTLLRKLKRELWNLRTWKAGVL
jgi:phosphotransferase family enzyme